VFSTSFRSFLQDESGAYAIWSLVWFSIYVAMGGLAVDVTDAYRNQTLLQATADASALAGVMSLPDEAAVLAEALAYSTDNMDPDSNGNGNVLKAEDVIIGNWNFDTRTFSTGGTSPNAVLARTRRSVDNDNPLATSFLRIINLWGIPGDVWTINTEAIATAFVSDCRRGGFVAGNKMDVTSGNFFFNEICIHGQNMIDDAGPDWGVDLNNDNTFETRDCVGEEEPPCGVQVSSSEEYYLNDRPNVWEKNDGLYDSFTAGDIYPTDALEGAVGNIIAGLTDPSSVHFRDYINTITDINDQVIPVTQTIPTDFAGPYVAGTIYMVDCPASNNLLSLPTGETIREVVIISDCIIKASSGLILEDVVVASTAKGNAVKTELDKKAIDLSSAARLGATTYCSDDVDLNGKGGVELYALASAQVAASLSMNGLRAVVGGDFQIAAQGTALGVSVQAGNDIIFTAGGSEGGGEFGLCPNDTLPPGHFALQYKLVL
jgi:Flp pilus assembly protein TadG